MRLAAGALLHFVPADPPSPHFVLLQHLGPEQSFRPDVHRGRHVHAAGF